MSNVFDIETLHAIAQQGVGKVHNEMVSIVVEEAARAYPAHIDPRSLSENADEELAFPFSFHGITPNHPAIILKHIIQTICYGIMATNNVIWSCDVSSFQIKPN